MNELLGVAAADGLRHLMSDQLAGAHLVPGEAVRLMVAWGATSVRIVSRRGGFEVRAPGATLPLEAAGLWARALAGGSGAVDAMTNLEDRGWQLPLWGAGFGATGTVILDAGGNAFRWGEAPGPAGRTSPHEAGVVVRMAMRLPTRAVRRAVVRSCRHAPCPVSLDGHDVRADLEGGVFRVRLRVPLPAEFVLGVRDRVARITLLRHGVVAARVSVSGEWPALKAVADITSLTRDPCSAADCRDAVRPMLRPLAEAAVGAGVGETRRLPILLPEARRRMVSLFLRAAVEGIQTEAIRNAPVIPLRTEEGIRMVSPEEVRAADGRLRRAPAGADGAVGLIVDGDDAAIFERLVGRDLAPHRIWPYATRRCGWREVVAAVRAAVRKVVPRELSDFERGLCDSLPWVCDGDPHGAPVRLMVVHGAMSPTRIGGALVAVGRADSAMQRAKAVFERSGDLRLAALAIVPPGFRVRLDT